MIGEAARGLCKIMVGMESPIRSTPWRERIASSAWTQPLRISFEAGVIAFAVGIAVYFAWPSEPSLVITLCLVCVGWIAAIHGGQALGSFALLMALVAAGISWSAARTAMSDTNPLVREGRMAITGTVVSIDSARSMRRLYIDVATADPLPPSGLPNTLRIRVGKAFGAVEAGDILSIDVVAGPLPGPAIPDGYDPGRRAFFDGLAGSGFAISEPIQLDATHDVTTQMKARLFEVRRSIADRVMEKAPGKTAGLQAALLTGLRDGIAPAQTESLRASGLAHILAISGLHMGMVAFGLFALVSIVLASVERFARGRDVRKPAALIALLGATLYLLLSGASVATQRAYIMVSIAFLAVLLDRRAISLRSVAVAALITLVIRPEALTSVGFQMSFAAVASMVVIFRAWQDWRPPRRADGFRDRLVAFYGSLFGTSLVAGLATGGFALLHFGRIAKYGLIANMAAMTVFPVVMAFGILSLAVMPLGWETLPLWAMGKLLTFMLGVSDWVAGLPGAVSTVKASSPTVLGLYGLGFALACLRSGRALVSGTALMALSILLWTQTPRYDLRISETGRVSVLSEELGQTSSLRADRYGRDQFARSDGNPDREWANYRDDFAQCDTLACRFIHKGHAVTVVEEPSEVPDACRDSAVVILASREAGPVSRRNCEAILIDERRLRESGGFHVRFEVQPILVPIRDPKRARRPWGRRAGTQW
ncbi:MAG: ComEC/Rec2 family competence protein [Litorimonas sp.]